jgi:hypothetical protein
MAAGVRDRQEILGATHPVLRHWIKTIRRHGPQAQPAVAQRWADWAFGMELVSQSNPVLRALWQEGSPRPWLMFLRSGLFPTRANQELPWEKLMDLRRSLRLDSDRVQWDRLVLQEGLGEAPAAPSRLRL